MVAPTNSEGKIWFAHMLRGIAALSVVIFHYGGIFWANNSVAANLAHTAPTVTDPNLLLVRITEGLGSIGVNLGAFGVALFFLISGFVIPVSLDHSGIFGFLVRRVFRLYPTYWAGLGIVFLCVFLYTRAHGVEYPLTIEAYLTNASLFRDWFWFASVDGINWTLEAEIKFYIVCALLVWLSNLRSAKTLVIVSAAFAVFVYVVSGMYDFLLSNFFYLYKLAYNVAFGGQLLIFMFIGTCLYNYHHRYWDRRTTVTSGAVLFGLFLWATAHGPAQGSTITVFSVNYTLALITFCACYALRSRLPYLPLLNFFANISYPLYAIHGVAGYIFLTELYSLIPNPYIDVAIAFGVAVFGAYALHRLIEIPSNNLGRHIERLVTVRFASAQPQLDQQPGSQSLDSNIPESAQIDNAPATSTRINL